MSRTAAPVGEVITPIRLGRVGRGRLRSAANNPSAASLGAQFLELTLQGAEAGVLHVIDDELEFAARLVQPDAGPHQHLLTVARGERTQHISLPEHRAAHLGGGVFQAKIPMSGTRPGEIGDFRLEPERAETALQQHAHLAVQARNAVYVALGACERTWHGLHGRNDSGLPHPPPKVQCAAS